MPYEEEQKIQGKTHTVSLENRSRMSLSGVDDVSGFDENLIVLSTAQGDLTVRGQELHIDKIDLDAGQLEVRGHIQELSYDEPLRGGTLWNRLFG